ncbi:MAG: hypothetical protein R3304_03565 [Longimicrobiales bacterium]|nr:hypothetical protein [Longimicrobiales bacterium]
MPICSYLVIPEPGAKERVRRRLSIVDGCEVVEAENRDILILVTETEGLEEEDALRGRVEGMAGIEALLFTFGQIDPETEMADPVRVGGKRVGVGPRERSSEPRGRREGLR